MWPIRSLNEALNREVLADTTYSDDLIPCDYPSFALMDHALVKQRPRSPEKVKKSLYSCNSSPGIHNNGEPLITVRRGEYSSREYKGRKR